RSRVTGRVGAAGPRRVRAPMRRPSGRQPLPPLGAAALDDRLTGPRGHAGAKAVLALPTADVGLVRALHEDMKEAAAGRPSRASIAAPARARLSTGRRLGKCARRAEAPLRDPRARGSYPQV